MERFYKPFDTSLNVKNNILNISIDSPPKDASWLDKQHSEVHEDIRFIKENLFNPHEGLWAETKLNSQFRADTKKWRGVIGTGFVGLLIKHIVDMFKSV